MPPLHRLCVYMRSVYMCMCTCSVCRSVLADVLSRRNYDCALLYSQASCAARVSVCAQCVYVYEQGVSVGVCLLLSEAGATVTVPCSVATPLLHRLCVYACSVCVCAHAV